MEEVGMHIELGVHVWTQEGKEVGKVSKLVVDTDAQTLDSFVVHTQWMGNDLTVPMDKVERVDADETIHLTIAEEQFLQLPQYFVEKFVTNSASPGMEDYDGASRGMMPLSTPGLSGSTPVGQEWTPGSGPFIGYVDMSSSVVTEQSSMSENEFGISKGTKVLAGDGSHVGNVHELSVTDDGKLRGLIVTSGHIIKHQRFIPMEEVADADSSAVYVRLSASDFHHLTQTEQPESEQQSGQP
jgi:sporulation protein YlmC with PRC-barrel domain